jgi:uncharacterized protein YndB with AHSA1/START domain
MTNPQPLGQIHRLEKGWRLRFERTLAHAPDKVWRALTESAHLHHWMPCDIVGERRAGAKVAAPFWPEVVERFSIEQPNLAGEIRVWEPHRVFEWRWDTDVLRFELEPSGQGTQLTLTTWVAEEPPAVVVAAGYHACLANLASVLDTGGAPPLVDADHAGLEALYAQVAAT